MGGARGANLIILPLMERGVRADFRKKEPANEGIVRLLPPKIIDSKEIAGMLDLLLPGQAGAFTHLHLIAPPKVKMRSYPFGFEFYDTLSERPRPFSQKEDISEISEWAKYWYFSAMRKGDAVLGRFLDRSGDIIKCPGIEQPISGFSGGSRHSLETFVWEIQRHESGVCP